MYTPPRFLLHAMASLESSPAASVRSPSLPGRMA